MIRRQYNTISSNKNKDFFRKLNYVAQHKSNYPFKEIVPEKDFDIILYIKSDNNLDFRSFMLVKFQLDIIVIRSFVGEINDFHYLLQFLIKENKNFFKIIYYCQDIENHVEAALDHSFYHLSDDENVYFLCKVI